MKIIYSAIIVLLCIGQGMTQTPITISALPTIVPGKIDSCNLPTSTAIASLPSLAPVTNGSWDLGTTALLPDPFTYTYKVKTPGFSTGTFSDSMVYAVGTTGIVYTCWRNVQQSSGSVSILGEEIIKRQAKPLGPITGNPIDSLIFSTQTMAFSNTIPVIKFPATMSSSWSATANRAVNFNVTVTALALSNAPGQHKQIRNSIDSVVGWGRMKLPVVGKPASAWIQVLQVQHSDIFIDSFFVNGAQAPAAVLAAFGVSQGQSSTVSRTFFYRSGAFRPLVEAVHSAPSHTSSVSKLYMHALDLPDATGVSQVTTVGNVRIYPNPLHDGKLHIDMPDAMQDVNYTLININGQLMAKGALPATTGGNTVNIDLPHQLVAGIYYLTLSGSNKQPVVLPLTIE